MDITGFIAFLSIIATLLLLWPRHRYTCGCGYATRSPKKALEHAQHKHIVE